MKLLLVVGNGKIGRKLISEIEAVDHPDIHIILDSSSSIKRVIKLIRRGTLSLPLVFKMFFADFMRTDYKTAKYHQIFSNDDLLNILQDTKPNNVVLFRAGLIINKRIIDTGIPLFNVHCLKLPEYGGLGQLMRALNNKDYEQCATCHHVTQSIDDGDIIATHPFQLDGQKSYKQNEDIAYDAGIKLIQNLLDTKLLTKINVK